jgi:hypothetical protein
VFLHSLKPFLTLYCNCQFNSSAPKLISWHTGVSKFDSILCCYCQNQSQSQSQSQSYFMTGGLQPISSSWRRAPSDSRPEFLFSIEHLRSYSLYNILSEERMGLSLTIVSGSRQCIHSRIRVLWDSRPYLNVLDSRLPFLTPPTIRRATMEVYCQLLNSVL